MHSFAATLPVLASVLALASAGELPLTPVASYPDIRPTPAPYTPVNYNPGGPAEQRPTYPSNTQPPHHQPSVFMLTQVPANPTATGTPTSPEKCAQVAARITPQLTPKPTYPPSLKIMADKMGGIDRDTCGDMDFKGKFKSVQSSDMNRFTQARYQTFILPLWAKVHELWTACGEETHKMQSIAQEPCYRWALELSKSSNGSSSGKMPTDKQGKPDFDQMKPQDMPQGNVRTPEMEAGAAQSRIPHATAIGLVGLLSLLWSVVLA